MCLHQIEISIMILVCSILFIISFFLWQWKNALKNLAIVSLLFSTQYIIIIIHSYRHLNLQDDAEDQVVGNHLLHRHLLTGRISHTHLTPLRSEGPVCAPRAVQAKIKSVRTVSEQILGQQLRVNPDNLGAALSQNPSFSSCFSFSFSVLMPSFILLPLPFIALPLKPSSCPFWRQSCFLRYLPTGWAVATVTPKATNCYN